MGSIEAYYPVAWKKDEEQVKKMNGELKLNLARSAGDAITKAEFEKDMPKLFEALKQAWKLAYK